MKLKTGDRTFESHRVFAFPSHIRQFVITNVAVVDNYTVSDTKLKANAPWQTWSRKVSGFGWATFVWASCNIDIVVTLVLHWTLLSNLSYNQAYMPRRWFESTSSLAHHCTKWTDGQHSPAWLEPLLVPNIHFPKPHYNRPSGLWPCVKSYFVGGRDKYGVFFWYMILKNRCYIKNSEFQSIHFIGLLARTLEYANCFSAKEQDPT